MDKSNVARSFGQPCSFMEYLNFCFTELTEFTYVH